MRSNRRMQELLGRVGLAPPRLLKQNDGTETPVLLKVDDCVFLRDEYYRSRGVTLDQFPDKTGIECFINHVHFRSGEEKQLMERAFSYVATLSQSLSSLQIGTFQIIVSVSDGICTVRFHKCRPGEQWLSDDLERYKDEAILVVTV